MTKRAFLILGFLASVLAASRIYTRTEPLESDLTAYSVVAREMLNGRKLYSEIWDHKPPAIHLTYAAGQLAAGYNETSLLLINLLASLATLLALYFGANRLAGPGAGLWAAAFWTVISGDLRLQANQPNTEVFINALAAFSFLLFFKITEKNNSLKNSLSAGFLAGLAALYKPVAAAYAGFFSLAVLLSVSKENRGKALFHLLYAWLAAALPWLVVTACFLAAGTFRDYFDAVFVFNSFYSNFVPGAHMAHPGIIFNLLAGLRPENLFPGILWFSLALLLPGGLVIFSRAPLAGLPPVCRPGPNSRDTRLLFITAYCAATFAAVASPGRFYAHYYQLWLPPLILFCAMGIKSAAARFSSRGNAFVHAASALVLALLLLHELPDYRLSPEEWSCRKYGSYFSEGKKFGLELGGLLKPEDTFYMWGRAAGLYFYSGKRPPAGCLDYTVMTVGPLKYGMTRKVLESLKKEKPRLVVIAPGYLPRIPGHPVAEWISANYPFRLLNFPGAENFIILSSTDSLDFIKTGSGLRTRNVKF